MKKTTILFLTLMALSILSLSCTTTITRNMKHDKETVHK